MEERWERGGKGGREIGRKREGSEGERREERGEEERWDSDGREGERKE